MSNETATPSRKPSHAAFQVRDANGKGFWSRIGAAFENRDGSLTVVLECLPLDGRIVLQAADKKPE